MILPTYGMKSLTENYMIKRQEKVLNLVLVAILAALTLTLTACNTTEGFGKDVKSAGNSIEKSANDNK